MSPADLSGQQVVTVQALDPATVACPPALLACALLTLGVREHPSLPFTDTTEEVAGVPRRVWQWVFEPRSADGLYETARLVKWWQDEAWLAANPRHELAIVKAVLENFAEVARRVRATVPRVIVRKGDLAAHIPANASPERRAWLLGKLEGSIPLNATFAEPAST